MKWLLLPSFIAFGSLVSARDSRAIKVTQSLRAVVTALRSDALPLLQTYIACEKRDEMKRAFSEAHSAYLQLAKQKKVPPTEFNDDLSHLLAKKILMVSKRHVDKAVPFLTELFLVYPKLPADEAPLTPDTGEPYVPRQFHETVLFVLDKLDTDGSSLVRIMDAFVEAGPRGMAPKSYLDPSFTLCETDALFAFVLETALKSACKRAKAPQLPSFERYFNMRYLDYPAREPAYYGLLRARMDKYGVTTPEKRVAYVAKELTSPGFGEWDYFHSLVPLDAPSGKKEWAIKDTARCALLIDEGPAALPELNRRWLVLREKPDDRKTERRKRAICHIISNIYYNAGKRPPKDLRLIPVIPRYAAAEEKRKFKKLLELVAERNRRLKVAKKADDAQECATITADFDAKFKALEEERPNH